MQETISKRQQLVIPPKVTVIFLPNKDISHFGLRLMCFFLVIYVSFCFHSLPSFQYFPETLLYNFFIMMRSWHSNSKFSLCGSVLPQKQSLLIGEPLLLSMAKLLFSCMSWLMPSIGTWQFFSLEEMSLRHCSLGCDCLGIIVHFSIE